MAAVAAYYTPHSYSTYKPSGVKWLGNVPEHWDVCAVKQRFEIQLGKMLQTTPHVADDKEVPYLKAVHVQWFRVQISDPPTMWASPREIEQFGVRTGDLLICEGGEGGRSGIVSSDVSGYIIQNALHRVRPKALGSNRYLQYVMFTSTAYGWHDAINDKATIAHFTREKLAAFRLPLPPLAEQRAIVRYLDHADRRIRRYVDAKRKLIALLEEEKQAVIDRAVTRGLDPNVRLKPSGVEWLGDVPAHWEVRRLSQVSGILRGKFTHRPRNDPSLYDGPYPFIQTGDISGASKRIIGYKQTLNEQGLAVSTMFPRGTLVMTIAANIGDVAILDFDACFPDSVVGLAPSKIVYRDHLYYVLRAMKQEFLREAPVNTQGNLNIGRIGSRKVAFPPLDEQAAIVEYLDKATADIDDAITRARRQIELVEEYRTRLVADVVSGKLDVREAAAQLPGESGHMEASTP